MVKKNKNTLLRSASVISLLTMVSRIMGVLRELLIASVFGAGAFTDAFVFANRIPNFFRRLFAEGAFSQAFIPVLAHTKENSDEQSTKQMINHTATLLAWVLFVFSVLGVLFAPYFVWLIASGLKDKGNFALVIDLTRIMFPYIGFMSLVALASAILNTWNKFALPAATPVLYNLCMIMAILVLAPYLDSIGIEPIYALAIGVLVGGIVQLLFQALALKRLGLWPRIGWRFSTIKAAAQNATSKRIMILMMPALLAVSGSQISLIINSQIASYLIVGSATWLNWADRLMELPIAVIGVALGVVLMPKLAGAKARQDNERYSTVLDWGLRLVVLLGLPAGVALIFFSQPLVATLYHYGAFSVYDLHQVSIATMGYGFGILGLIAIKVLTSAFFANQDVKTPVKAVIIAVIVTQLLNIVLVPWLAHAGLALSIGCGALVNSAVLLTYLIRRKWLQARPGWPVFTLRIICGCVVLGLFLSFSVGLVDWEGMHNQPLLRLVAMLAMVAGAMVIYFAMLKLLGLQFKQFLTARD